MKNRFPKYELRVRFLAFDLSLNFYATIVMFIQCCMQCGVGVAGTLRECCVVWELVMIGGVLWESGGLASQ